MGTIFNLFNCPVAVAVVVAGHPALDALDSFQMWMHIN